MHFEKSLRSRNVARHGSGQPERTRKTASHILRLALCLLLVMLLLTGCLEQLQSPRSSGGALTNFFMHLYTGALDDARAYFAPGLVEMTPELDRTIEEAADRLRS